MVHALERHPERPARDISSLRTGATLGSPEQIKRLIDLGVSEICNIYGLTETYGNSNVTDVDDPLEKRLNTVGRTLPGTEIVIADPESLAPLPTARSAKSWSGAMSPAATTRTRRSMSKAFTTAGSAPATSGCWTKRASFTFAGA